MNIINAYKHCRKIMTHRKWVRYYCFKCGLYWRGITHDLSKYSPIEFLESVKYYQGTSSPIKACKAANGYSRAWLHHKGRNTHHYQYWMDNFDKGGECLMMPYPAFAEMVCDYLGAAHAYNGSEFNISSEYDWWQNERQVCAMNPKNKAMLDIIFWDLMKIETETGVPHESLLSENYLRKVYEANK